MSTEPTNEPINQVMARLMDPQRLVVTGSPVVMRDALARQILPHNMRILKPPKRAGELRSMSFGAIKIFFISYGADVLIGPLDFKDHYCIDMPLRGRTWMRSDDMDLIAVPGEATLTSPGKVVSYLQEADCELVTVLIRRSAIDNEVARQLGAMPSKPVRFQPRAALNCGGGRSWLSALATMCLQLGDPESLLSQGRLVAEAEQWLLATLLAGLSHNYSGALSGDRPGTYIPHYLRVVEDLISERLADDIDIDDLANATGMSRRSLFAAFRKHFNKSPMSYIRARRLEAVRGDLLRADPASASVTDIAGRWGFGNLGNFSVAYRRAYGETPSCTLRRTII